MTEEERAIYYQQQRAAQYAWQAALFASLRPATDTQAEVEAEWEPMTEYLRALNAGEIVPV